MNYPTKWKTENFEFGCEPLFFASDLKGADVVVATAFPSLESMGPSMMKFFGGEANGVLFAKYQTIVNCHGRELWAIEQTR